MLLPKLKKAVTLMTIALVLTASAGAWCYVAVAGQDEERPQEIPAPAAPKAVVPQAPKNYPQPTAATVPEADAAQTPMAAPKPLPSTPRAVRAFQIDLQVTEMKDGKRKLVTEPRLQTLEGRPASFVIGGYRAIPLGGGNTEQVLIGTTIRTVIRSGKENKVHLDITVSQPTRTTISDAVTLETKTLRHITETALDSHLSFAVDGKDSTPLIVTVGVREVKSETGEKTIAEAEKYLRFAGFYRRTGYLDWARFYYELILRRYPDTVYAERAKKGLSELREIVRVGQIVLIGNKKTSDATILGQVPLFPGQILTVPDFQIARQIAEQDLSRLKGLKSKPVVKVIDGHSEFKDIEIKVEEK
jgi:hypothetical protein